MENTPLKNLSKTSKMIRFLLRLRIELQDCYQVSRIWRHLMLRYFYYSFDILHHTAVENAN